MAARVSLTGVAVNSGYVQLIHVGDDAGITSSIVTLYDGNGTATALGLGTVSGTVTLGTSASNDWTVTNGTVMVLYEGDSVAHTFTGDATSGSDFVYNDGAGAIVTFKSDTNQITFNLDGSTGADFLIQNATANIIQVETDDAAFLYTGTSDADSEFVVDIQTSAGNDFRVTDGTDDLIHVQGDLGSVTINLATGSGNDFAVNNGTDDLLLIQADLKSVIFDLAGGAGGDLSVTDGTTDMLLIQTDDDTVDIVGHDASAKGLMLAGTLVTATALEINQMCDESTIVQTITTTGNVTAGVRFVELDHTSTAIVATIANSNNHVGYFSVLTITEPGGAQDHTCVLTSGTWNGTNNTATFDTINDGLIVHFDSAGRGKIILDTGAIAFS